MNAPSKARALAYATSALVGIAVLLKTIGLADYDSASGMFDLHPVSIYTAAAFIAPVFSAALAFVALVRGWGQK